MDKNIQKLETSHKEIKSSILKTILFISFLCSMTIFIIPFWVPPMDLKEENKPYFDPDKPYKALLNSRLFYNELKKIWDEKQLCRKSSIDSLLCNLRISLVNDFNNTKIDSNLHYKLPSKIDSCNLEIDSSTTDIINGYMSCLKSGMGNFNFSYFLSTKDTAELRSLQNIVVDEHKKVINEIQECAATIESWVHYKFLIAGGLISGILLLIGFGKQDERKNIGKKFEDLIKEPVMILLLSLTFSICIIIDIQIKNKVLDADICGLWIKNYVEPYHLNYKPKPFGKFKGWEQFLRIKKGDVTESKLTEQIIKLELIKQIDSISFTKSTTDYKALYMHTLINHVLSDTVLSYSKSTLEQIAKSFSIQSSHKFSFSKWVPQHALTFIIYVVVLFLTLNCISEKNIYWDNKYVLFGISVIHFILICFAYLNHSIPEIFQFKLDPGIIICTKISYAALFLSIFLNILSLIRYNLMKMVKRTISTNILLVSILIVQIVSLILLINVHFTDDDLIVWFFMLIALILVCINFSIIMFYDIFEDDLRKEQFVKYKYTLKTRK